MLPRIRSGGDVTTEQQDQETRRAIHGVRNNFPDAFRTMRPNANDVRRFLKNTGREKPKNMPLSGVPILKLGQQEFLLAVKRFTTKLFCALHYKHVGAIVPATGVIASHFFSNVQVFDGKIPSDILTVVQGEPTLTRSKNDLHEQFSYQFVVTIEKTTSVYLCSFRESFALIGMVCSVDDLPDVFNEDIEQGRFRRAPFRHS